MAAKKSTTIQSDIDIVLERLRQADACVVAIDNVLIDRGEFPEQDTLADRVLQGLASAASELLHQATDAATRGALAPKAQKAKVAHD